MTNRGSVAENFAQQNDCTRIAAPRFGYERAGLWDVKFTAIVRFWRWMLSSDVMSQNLEPTTPEVRSLLEEIRRVFEEVQRGDGVTLHETVVIDMYGSKAQRRTARKKDTDTRWWEVRDDWIEKFGGVGGLSFLDDAGFRYYLPAYMSYFLRRRKEPNCLTFHLSGGRRNFDLLFSPAQKSTIARFLEFVCERFDVQYLAPEVLEKEWAHYLNPR